MEHNHRLYDFVAAGEAICAAAGLAKGTFVRSMDDLRKGTGAELAAGDDFIVATRAMLEALAKAAKPGEALPGYKRWFDDGAAAVQLKDGSTLIGIRPKALFELSRRHYPYNGQRDSWAPRNERETAGALLRTIPVFSDIGIGVEKREPSRGHAFWEFRLRPVEDKA